MYAYYMPCNPRSRNLTCPCPPIFFGWNGQAPIRDFATPELLPPSIATAEEVEEKAKHFLRQLGGRWGKIGEMSSGENGELFVGRGMSTICLARSLDCVNKAIFVNFKATDRGFLDLKTNWKFNHLQSQGGDFTTCHGVSLG